MTELRPTRGTRETSQVAKFDVEAKEFTQFAFKQGRRKGRGGRNLAFVHVVARGHRVFSQRFTHYGPEQPDVPASNDLLFHELGSK